MPNFAWQLPSTSVVWSHVNNDSFQMTTPPPAAQVPMSPASFSVSVDPTCKVKSMFAPPKPIKVPLNDRGMQASPPIT